MASTASAREDPVPVRLVGVERVVLYVNVIHVAVRTAVVPTVHVYVQTDGMESTVLWKVILTLIVYLNILILILIFIELLKNQVID